MSTVTCPACAAQVSADAATCPNCGKPLTPEAPIRRVGGKLQAAGVILLAGAVVAMVSGAWWGAALLFPGAVFFILGRFW